MSITTDPRNVTSGRVRVSCSSSEKRDALVGRFVRVHHLQDGPRIGRVESVDGSRTVVRFPDGGWCWSDSIVELVATRTVVEQDHAEALAENVAHDLAMEKAQELSAAMLVQFATPRTESMPRQLRARLQLVRSQRLVPPARHA